MTQHKCGTCRYFEEGGFAGSGRCGHPLRKNIQQMVLVRKSELACRSDWANDLWEPRADAEPVSIASNHKYSSEASRVDDRRQYTDRVTSVGVAPSRQSQPEPPPPASKVDAGNFTPDVGAEPRQMHEPIIPDAQEEQEKPVSRAAGSISDRESRDLHDPRTESPRSQVTPAPTRREDLRTPERDEVNRDRGASSARPVSDSDDLEERLRRLQSSTESAVRAVPPPSIPDSSSTAQQSRRPMPDHRPGQSQHAPQQEPSGETKPVPRPAAPARTFGATPEKIAGEELPQGRSGWTEPFAVPTQTPRHASIDNLPSTVEAPPAAEIPAKQPLGPQVTPRQTSLKECCGTCRDFRPAEGGERGWCNNAYAFEHRTMVEKSQLACKSTIGSWWIASDDWWLQRADITHHGRPTPIVDDLLRQLLQARTAATNRRVNRS